MWFFCALPSFWLQKAIISLSRTEIFHTGRGDLVVAGQLFFLVVLLCFALLQDTDGSNLGVVG